MLSRCLVFKDGCCYLEAAIAAVAAVAAVSDVAGDDAVILVADIAVVMCLLGAAVFCGN